MYYKGYKIRLYPTKEQEQMILKHIGAYRYIWNYMLQKEIEQRDNDGFKFLQRSDLLKILSDLKKKDDYYWLNEVSTVSLQHACFELIESYQYFFKHQKGHPKFKSKKNLKQSYQVRNDRTYFSDKGVKIEKVGFVKYKTDFDLPKGFGVKIFNVRLYVKNNKYMLSFSMECENQAPELNDLVVGIDLGIKELAVCAFEDKSIVFHNINKSQKIRDLYSKAKYYQKSLSRKQNAFKIRNEQFFKTQNYIKALNKLRKAHERIRNIRHNYIHQTTASIISLNPKIISMETLSVQDMLKTKNKTLRRLLGQQCFHEFLFQMKYKCMWHGIEFVQVPQLFPSSKICSCCGNIKKDLSLSTRKYVCSECGFISDRDYNAAINLMKYGIQHKEFRL